MSILASISIGINPNLIDFGNFTLSWHGVMTFVAVATAVWLVGMLAVLAKQPSWQGPENARV